MDTPAVGHKPGEPLPLCTLTESLTLADAQDWHVEEPGLAADEPTAHGIHTVTELPTVMSTSKCTLYTSQQQTAIPSKRLFAVPAGHRPHSVRPVRTSVTQIVPIESARKIPMESEKDPCRQAEHAVLEALKNRPGAHPLHSHSSERAPKK